jgi:hypothetical protein
MRFARGRIWSTSELGCGAFADKAGGDFRFIAAGLELR